MGPSTLLVLSGGESASGGPDLLVLSAGESASGTHLPVLSGGEGTGGPD